MECSSFIVDAKIGNKGLYFFYGDGYKDFVNWVDIGKKWW
jgi:hypothetical protein